MTKKEARDALAELLDDESEPLNLTEREITAIEYATEILHAMVTHEEGTA